jgi:hypothetical protein
MNQLLRWRAANFLHLFIEGWAEAGTAGKSAFGLRRRTPPFPAHHRRPGWHILERLQPFRVQLKHGGIPMVHVSTDCPPRHLG